MVRLTLTTHLSPLKPRVRFQRQSRHCWWTDAHATWALQLVAVRSELPEQVWCVSEWRIRGRAVSATAAAPPPEPTRRRGGRSGVSEIRPLAAIAVDFLSPWFQLPLLLSAMFHPLSPPSPESLHPSAPQLLPLDDDGRYDGYDGEVLGHLVMPLLLLDTYTSTTFKEEGQG